MAQLVSKTLNNTSIFETVDEFPQGYYIWNIGRHNFKFSGYIPLARPSSIPYHIDTNTLKALKVESEELALYLLDCAAHGDVNYFDFQTKVKEFHEKISPAIKQYKDMKEKHPDAMLLYRVGEFYETYNKDAEDAAEILGITLTDRKYYGNRYKMASFPFHALDTYLPKLVRRGRRVCIVDALTAPTGNTKRKVVEKIEPYGNS